MAREIRHYTATIPAGTAIGSPVTIDISFPARVVTQVDWRVPNGPMGVFGWRLTMGTVKVLPDGNDLWVIANDEHGSWPVHGKPDSGGWAVTGYNTGANPHSVYLAIHCDLPEMPVQLATLIPAYELMPAPDLSQAGPPVRGHP